MAKMTPEQTSDFLELPNIAHFITLRADGTPHSAPVWYEYADERFYVFTPADSLKLTNLARDPRMTLSIANENRPYQYVVASGEGRRLSSDVTSRAVSVASRYEGEGGARFIADLAVKNEVVVIEMTATHLMEYISG
jgi:PPOX class probable F420-dependent enzyme